MISNFHRQISEHRQYLLTYAKKLSWQDQEAAEDLVQNTYVAAIRFESTFQPGTNMRAWLKTILYNDFVNGFRRQRKEAGRVDFDMVYLGYQGPSVIPHRDEVGDEVKQAIAKLHPKDRKIVVMSFIQDYTYEEIAKVVGIPLGTVRSRLHRSRKILQQSLREYQRAS